MFIPDVLIRQYIKDKKIIISPHVSLEDIRSVGIRIHLGEEIIKFDNNQTIDLENPKELKYKRIKISKNGYLLKKGDFILASTKEKIQTTNNLITFIDGRSTIARMGLTVHVSSQVVDGNHDELRSITLELKNLGNVNIRICYGYPIAMVYFALLAKNIKQADQTQYKSQSTVSPPNLRYKTGFDK